MMIQERIAALEAERGLLIVDDFDDLKESSDKAADLEKQAQVHVRAAQDLRDQAQQIASEHNKRAGTRAERRMRAEGALKVLREMFQEELIAKNGEAVQGGGE